MWTFGEFTQGKEPVPIPRKEFSWFSIERYRNVSSLSLQEWYCALSARADAFAFKNNVPELSLAELEGLFNQPLTKAWPPQRPCIQVGQMLSEWSLISDGYGATVFECLPKRYQASPDFTQLPDDVFEKSVRDLYKSKEAPHALPVRIDLMADDKKIQAAFRTWLSGVRKEFGSAPSKAKQWSEARRRSWSELHVLPYIDLVIYCNRVLNRRATNNTLGEVLYPDDYETDRADRIRKVVEPTARELLSCNFLTALHRQLFD